MNRYFILPLFFVFLSCSKEERATVLPEKIKVENIEKVQRIKPKSKVLIDSVLGAFSIANDSKHIFLRVPESSESKGLLQIFNKKGVLEASVLNRGGGPNDVINARIIKQRNEKNSLWINDVTSRKLKLLNVSESISNQSAKIDEVVRFNEASAYAFFIKDSLFVLETMKNSNYWLTFFNPITETTVFDKPIYPNSSKHFTVLYQSIWAAKNDKTWIVGAMEALNQINFVSLVDAEKSFSVSLGSATNVEKAIDNAGVVKHAYYCDVATTSKYVFALKLDQAEGESYKVAKPVTVEVLDWNGKPQCVLEIDEYLLDISVDEEFKKIYGLGIDGTVYEYGLNTIL
ncbi:BF3164 family lipoprotein [Capnocytophaga canis]|uniref:BF3164 family lipoprotein n=1 Tax=Capnocytophaga canis TaxID=1848903 RepID=UPI001561F38B|nr:BF3164 family lipoprotein [Capnocytophaga canis]